MNEKELYALCYVLMGDDHPTEPQMQAVNRKFLTQYADQRAKELGSSGWIEWYVGAVMPFTQEDFQGAQS